MEKEKKMSPVNDKYVLARAIEDSYGQVLKEWKELDMLPEKKLMLTCVNTLSTAFIVENYDLSASEEEIIVKELLRDVSTQDALNAIYEFKDSLEESGIDLPFPSRNKLNASDLLNAFRSEKVFLPHSEYSWETIRELYTLDNTIFNSEDISNPVFKSMGIFLKMLSDENLIDFNSISNEPGLLKDVSNYLWGLSGSINTLQEIKENKTFLKKILDLNCLPDSGLSHSFVSVLSSKEGAKSLLKSFYSAEKRLYLMNNGLGDIHPVVAMYEKTDPREWNRRMKIRADLQKEFKNKQEKLGEWADFTYVPSMQDFKRKIFEYLSLDEINEITEGNYLGTLYGKDVDKNLEKIKYVLENAGNVEKRRSLGLPSFSLLFRYEDLCPVDGMEKVFTPELVNKILGFSVESSDYDEKNNTYEFKWKSKSIRNVYKINNTSLYDIYIKSDKILNMAKAVIKDKESVNSVDCDFLLCSMLYVDEAVIGEKSNNYIKNNGVNELILRANKIKDFLIDTPNLFNFNRFATKEVDDYLSVVFDNMFDPMYRMVSPEEQELKPKLIEEMANELLKVGGFNMSYFVSHINASDEKFDGLTTSENQTAREISYFIPATKNGNNSHPYQGEEYNFLLDHATRDTEFAKSIKIKSKVYQDYIIANNITVSDNVLNSLYESIYYCTDDLSQVEDDDEITYDSESLERIEFAQYKLKYSIDFVMLYFKDKPQSLANFMMNFNESIYKQVPEMKEFIEKMLKPEDLIQPILKAEHYNAVRVLSEIVPPMRDLIADALLNSERGINMVSVVLGAGYSPEYIMKFKDSLGERNLCNEFLKSNRVNSIKGLEPLLPRILEILAYSTQSGTIEGKNTSNLMTNFMKIAGQKENRLESDYRYNNSTIHQSVSTNFPLFFLNTAFQEVFNDEKTLNAKDVLSLNKFWLENESNRKLISFPNLQKNKNKIDRKGQLSARDDWMSVNNNLSFEDSVIKNLSAEEKVMLYVFADMFKEMATPEEVLASSLLSPEGKEIYKRNPESYEITKMRLKVNESFGEDFIKNGDLFLFELASEYKINLAKLFNSFESIDGLSQSLKLSTKEELDEAMFPFWKAKFRNSDLNFVEDAMNNESLRNYALKSFEMNNSISIKNFFQLFSSDNSFPFGDSNLKKDEFAEIVVSNLFMSNDEPLIKEFLVLFKAIESNARIKKDSVSLGMKSLLKNGKIKEMCHAISLKLKMEDSFEDFGDDIDDGFDSGSSMKL